MKKVNILLAFILAFSMLLCACKESPTTFNDGTGNNEMLSMENKKISTDNIDFSIISEEEQKPNMIKTYKTEFTAEDFSVKWSNIKTSDYIYVSAEDEMPTYPKRTELPTYDTAVLEDIVVSLYEGEYGAFDRATGFITAPTFQAKNFTGKLVISYKVYTSPMVDSMGNKCFAEGKNVVLTCDLYEYKIG